MTKGMTHIYTGDGKGKTTAAVGMAIRATSRGLKTLFAQFFKENEPGGEIRVLQEIGVKTIIFDAVKSPFFNPAVDKAFIRDEALKALSSIRALFERQEFDLIILDEFNCLIAESVLSEDEAVELLKIKPYRVELVLTGSGATERMLSLADYVTFMKNVKHPYDRNLNARRGIEF